MKEENIRPDNLIQENHKLRDEDIAQLMKKSSNFVKIPCPACESNNHQFMFEKMGFTFVRCLDCQTCYINPRPTFPMIIDFYENSKCIKHWKKIFAETENIRRSEIFQPRASLVVELCKRYSASTSILLDVGAGSGAFCEEIKKLRFFKSIIAVEPSKELADTCRQKEVDVIEKPIENVELENVSVITNFELIEHLFWPKDFVLACSKRLTKGGLLVITTPNIKGFDLMTLGKISDGIVGPNHLNYFHIDSLSKLVSNCGFDVIQVLTPGKLDAEIVRKKIIKGDFNVDDQPFLKYLLIDKWDSIGTEFQKFLADNCLSSHLWLVAKKR